MIDNGIGIGEFVRGGFSSDDISFGIVRNMKRVDGEILYDLRGFGLYMQEDIYEHSRNIVEILHVNDYANGERIKEVGRDKQGAYAILSNGTIIRHNEEIQTIQSEDDFEAGNLDVGG